MSNIIRSSYFQHLEDAKREKYVRCKEEGKRYLLSQTFYEGHHYIAVLDAFVKSGEIPVTDTPWNDDYLEKYLREVMSDSFIAYNVLCDEVKARIFYDNMLAFIKQIIAREKFRKSCAKGQLEGMEHALQWSERKKREGWSRLLSEISNEYQEFGFDERYYRDKFEKDTGLEDPHTWEKMIEDWAKVFEQKQQQLRNKDVEQIKQRNSETLKKNLDGIPKYLNDKKIEKEYFYQAWGLMGGMWNTLLFEQKLKYVKLQKKYPQLEHIANKMGRIADEESAERMPVAVGGKMKIAHATKSDILGVSLGKDIKSMLPHELVLCCDDELHDLFLYKFATQNLQTFQHKSELLKPSRLVSPHPARIKGPMIVCVDRSGSMAGLPEELANSLMMKLLLIADRQKCDLFLISFSVNATPIDVRHDRTALLDFFKQSSIGDTNATQMLNMVFELLESGDYASADVLWFTDFIIPMCGIEQRRKITYYSRLGTKFYGLKIGKSLDKRGWENYFHEIVEIEK